MPCPDRHEGGSPLGDEVVFRPFESPLFAVIEPDTLVGLQLCPVMGKQLDGVVEAVGAEDDVPLLSGQDQEKDNEHDDRALGQLTRPG